MGNKNLMLLCITVILFGICAIILSFSQSTPNFHNEIYKLLRVVCPTASVVLSAIGFLMKNDKLR